MSALKVIFENFSGYGNDEVSIAFYSPSAPLNAVNANSQQPVAANTWYPLNNFSAGVSITTISGRIYFCYGKTFPFTDTLPQTPTSNTFFYRYDKVELTFSGSPADVADLTSIDYWSMPFQLQTKKNGVKVNNPVNGLHDKVTAIALYNSLLKLSTPPVSGIPGAIPALVPGQFTQPGNAPPPWTMFARIIGPSVYPPVGGEPASPYDTLESYLTWLNTTYGPGTGTNTVPGLGNGTIANVKGHFGGVGPVVPPSGPQSAQDYALTAAIDGSLGITMTGTVGSSPTPIKLSIAKADLLNPTGIYGANPPVSLNGAAPATLGNNVYSWILGDLLSGLCVGTVGSLVAYNGAVIGGMESSMWFFGNLPMEYLFTGAQPNNTYYSQFAATIHALSDAYGFPYAERFTHVFATLDPNIVDTLEITMLEAVLPPEFLVMANQAWQDTGIEVTGGDVITYQAGLWTADPNDNNRNLYDAHGNPTFKDTQPGFTMPGQNMGMLIGKVNDTMFAIGKNGTVPAGLSGILQLCINDDLFARYGAGLTDNKGSVRVLVTHPQR